MLSSRRESRKRINGGAALFQLLDWNKGDRRRKNLKFVSSSAPPQAGGDVQKRLVGEDKVPLAKLLQIADENYTGFRGRQDQPLAAYESTSSGYSSAGVLHSAAAMKDERVRAAGLVARLMGLEFLPVMPPRDSLGEPLPPLAHLDQELLGRRVREVESVRRYPDLPARPHSSRRRSSDTILFTKPRQQRPHNKADSTPSATERPSTVEHPFKGDVDGISNLSPRKCSRPLGRHLKPFSSSHNQCAEMGNVKPHVRNRLLLDYDGHPVVQIDLSRQEHPFSEVRKKPSPRHHANENVSARKYNPNCYLERNQLLSRNSCQLNSKGLSNMGDSFPSALNLRRNHNPRNGEKLIVTESDLYEIHQSGCNSGSSSFQQFSEKMNSPVNTSMPNGLGNLEVRSEVLKVKKDVSGIRRSNNGNQVKTDCSRPQKHTQVQNDATGTKCTGHTSSPAAIKSRTVILQGHAVEENTATYITELTINSSETNTARNQPSSLPIFEERKTDSMLLTDTSNSRAGKLQTQGPSTMIRDNLGALLVHKIKELNCVDKDKKDRSSADILEELIFAMTDGEPNFPCHPTDDKFRETQTSSYPVHQLDNLQTNMISSSGSSPYVNGQRYSPPSILENSFSTESSVGESISITSGKDNHSGLTCYSCYDDLVSIDYDFDLLDSASSTSSASCGNSKISYLLEGLLTMYRVDLCTPHEGDPCCATEVISNLELILDREGFSTKFDKEETVMDSLILDTLETLVNACTSPSVNLVFPYLLDKYLVRRFLFDCIMEHLTLSYSYCFLSMYKGQVKLPLALNSDRLSSEVLYKMQHWVNLAGFIGVERCCPLHLNNIEVESCLLGMEMEQLTTEALIDEMMIDIVSEWTGSQNACTAHG